MGTSSVPIPSTRRGKSGHFTVPSSAVKSRISNSSPAGVLTPVAGWRLIPALLHLTSMLEETNARVTGFKVFRPGVEAALKTLAVAALLALLVLPLAWGYQQRNEARLWREIACTYRLREALSDGRLLTPADRRGDPCERLSELGLQLARRAD